MIEGIDVSQRIEFTSKEDTKEPKTAFILRPLKGFEAVSFSRFIKNNKLELSGEYIEELLLKSIVEVKNPPKKAGEDPSVKAVIDCLSSSVIMELVMRIWSIKNLSEQERKN